MNNGQHNSLRLRSYSVLERADTLAGRVISILLAAIIALNVTAVIVESVSSVYQQYKLWFRIFEILSVAIFTIEYAGRVWSCVEDPRYADGWRGRLRYMTTPMAVVDFVAIAPFYLGFFIEADTRMLRALRLFRVFKLTRHSSSMDLLLTVIRNEAATVASSMFIMLIIIVFAASGMYLIEREAQPDAFQSIPQAMWWAAVTLTTVGYGDVVPLTLPGKVFGLFITFAGVGMVALPAGILASGFSSELQKRRAEYQLKLKKTLADGQVGRSELRELRQEAQDLGLSAAEARVLMKAEAHSAQSVCRHCGKPLG